MTAPRPQKRKNKAAMGNDAMRRAVTHVCGLYRLSVAERMGFEPTRAF